jgi:hypothetical protein
VVEVLLVSQTATRVPDSREETSQLGPGCAAAAVVAGQLAPVKPSARRIPGDPRAKTRVPRDSTGFTCVAGRARAISVRPARAVIRAAHGPARQGRINDASRLARQVGQRQSSTRHLIPKHPGGRKERRGAGPFRERYRPARKDAKLVIPPRVLSTVSSLLAVLGFSACTRTCHTVMRQCPPPPARQPQ